MKLKGIFVLLVWMIASSVYGQYDPQALSILDKMSNRIKSMKSFEADFKYILENRMEDLTEEFAGNIKVKGEKFVLKMEGQEIYNDGETVWTYFADVNEVNIDNYVPEESDMTPSKIYKAYKDGYKYLKLEDASKRGKPVHVVDLIPEDKSLPFFKIRLYVSKSNYDLVEWSMFDKTGNIYHYQIKDFEEISASEKDFVFNPADYKNVDVVDLR